MKKIFQIKTENILTPSFNEKNLSNQKIFQKLSNHSNTIKSKKIYKLK